jgi:hypothetical protein
VSINDCEDCRGRIKASMRPPRGPREQDTYDRRLVYRAFRLVLSLCSNPLELSIRCEKKNQKVWNRKSLKISSRVPTNSSYNLTQVDRVSPSPPPSSSTSIFHHLHRYLYLHRSTSTPATQYIVLRITPVDR